MKLSRIQLYELNSPNDWFKFVSNSTTSVESALEAHDRCWRRVIVSSEQLIMLQLLWTRFDDDNWRKLLTRNIVHHINAYANVFSEDMIGLPLYARDFYPSLKLCRNYLDKGSTLDGLNNITKVFIEIMLSVIDKKDTDENASLICKIALPEIHTDEEICDLMCRVGSWHFLAVLPLTALQKILSAVKRHPNFELGSESDLVLCHTLASKETHAELLAHVIEPLKDRETSAVANLKFDCILQLAKDNRYFRSLVFNMFNDSLFDELPGKQYIALVEFAKASTAILSPDNIVNVLMLVEQSYDENLPEWFKRFVKEAQGVDLETKADAWAFYVPNVWGKNVDSWDSLAMSHEEKVQACLMLVQPQQEIDITLPDSLDNTV